MKKYKRKCSHLNYDNERDCNEDAEYICMCCSEPVCSGHNEGKCPYGGEGFIEIE